MGIAFALVALLLWGLGDFLIQRSTRRFGDWIALFYVTALSLLVLTPLVVRDVGRLIAAPSALLLLSALSAIVLVVALLMFEALRGGKLSVIEPVLAVEIPVTAGLAAIVMGERLTAAQAIFMLLLIAGIVLVSTESIRNLRQIRFGTGVWYAVIAAAGMGLVNFLYGVGARQTSPLLVIWFTHLVIAVATFLYLLVHRRLAEIGEDFRRSPRLALSVSLVDTGAWLAYAASTLTIPIAMATGISEGYIALSALLGLLLNREKLHPHQLLGLMLSLGAVMVLAGITKA